MTINAVDFAQDLIRCQSVTPVEGGALDTLQSALEGLGFVCTRIPFSEEGTLDVDNLYARLGTEAPNLCFAGHTDVVPVGSIEGWSHDPFAADIVDGILYGRGAVDMKGSIASFVSAVSRYIADQGSDGIRGSISFLITGDEEGPAINGTVKMLTWLEEQGEQLDYCLVGEPTNPKVLGEMVKIGRRGSLNTKLVVKGQQGHVAYPHLSLNPLPYLIKILDQLTQHDIDEGNDYFQPSNLEVVTIDVGNSASNVIPYSGEARFNIRFNSEQTIDGLKNWIRSTCDTVIKDTDIEIDLEMRASGDSFITPPGWFSDIIASSIEKVTGQETTLSTTGGTSDARFIKNYCPVAEFGLISQTMHQVDECVAVKDIEDLADIYLNIVTDFFNQYQSE